jgi:hypothetical protein
LRVGEFFGGEPAQVRAWLKLGSHGLDGASPTAGSREGIAP